MTREKRLFARNLRLVPTDAERALWRHLRRHQMADAERDAWFAAQGFTVLRFWNNEVLAQSESVRARILATVTELQASRPPP